MCCNYVLEHTYLAFNEKFAHKYLIVSIRDTDETRQSESMVVCLPVIDDDTTLKGFRRHHEETRARVHR